MSQRQRRLAAIMFTDMVGYTALGQKRESLALALVEEQKKLVRSILQRHKGREVKTMGDAFLVEFPNALDAVRCAYDVQRATREFNLSMSEASRIHLRIGVHLGDVVESRGDFSGDAVNIASRIEPLAKDGGVCLTREVYSQVSNKLDIPLTSLGPQSLKNVKSPIEVYEMSMPWDEKGGGPSAQLDKTRIAVLPFTNMSPDPNDEYFADGITEEIISTVSGVSGLGVISRTSVMGYKGTTKSVKEIGRDLEVGSVLEGSFRKAGNRIRITVQLINVVNDQHLWVQSYDREFDDVFKIQGEIAKQVADSLRVEVLPHEETRINKEPTRSPEAHSLCLEGRYYWNRRSKEALLKAIGLYKSAIEIDPDYALAYSGIADCYRILGNHHYMSFSESLSKCKEYALKAVELDGTSAEAHASLGTALWAGKDNTAGEREFKRALELSPSYATAHHWYAVRLYYSGRLEDALREMLSAQELDPLSPMIATVVGNVYDSLSKYDLAERQHLRALELQPDLIAGMENLLWTYIHEGKYAEAESQVLAQQRVGADLLYTKLELAAIFALGGREKEARAIMAETERVPNPEHLRDFWRIVYHIAIGEFDTAIELIEDQYRREADWLGLIAFDPVFLSVRGDLRVVSILKDVGAVS